MSSQGAPYRVGIVGAGGASKLHLDGIKRHPERVQAAALCDPDGGVLSARAAEYGVEQCYGEVKEMIAKAKLGVAIICTPTHVRREVLLPFMEAGVPILCEKPFAETYTEALRIARIIRASRVPIAVNQNFRRHFTFALGRDLLARGDLRKPLHLTQVSSTFRQDKGWRLERDRYVMAVTSIHWFDGYRFLLRDEPERVYCTAVKSPATPGGKDMAISAILRFQQGTLVNLTESFASFADHHQWCVLDCQAGSLQLGYDTATELRADGRRFEHKNPFDKIEATYYLLDEVLKAFEQKRTPETAVVDNVKSVRVMEAAYRSLAEDREVRLEEIQ